MNNHVSNIIDGLITSHSDHLQGKYFCDITNFSMSEIRHLTQTLFSFDEHFRELAKTYIDNLLQSRVHYAHSINQIGVISHANNNC
jgi:hypothetical protein